MKKALCFTLILVLGFVLTACSFGLKQPQSEAINRMIGFEAGVFVAGELPDMIDDLVMITEMALTKVIAHEAVLSKLSKLNQARLKNFLNLIEIQGPEITRDQAAAMEGFVEGLKMREEK